MIHKFNLNALLVCLLIVVVYLHGIYIVFTWFKSFTGYADDILHWFSKLHVQILRYIGQIVVLTFYNSEVARFTLEMNMKHVPINGEYCI